MQTFTPLQYLQIDVASNYGLDKEDWDVRIAWTETHEAKLETLISEAEEPALYYAGVKAYREAQLGNPIGYPIRLDATASGLQLLSVLSGDRRAAALCNVIDTGTRKNAYAEVYKYMLKQTGNNAKVSGQDVKDAVMTSLYGSEAVPKEVFGEGNLLEVFVKTMETVAPHAWELNKAYLAMWNSEALSHSWVLPDNYHVDVKVMDTERKAVHILDKPYDIFYKVNRATPHGRSLGANVNHSVDGMLVREMNTRTNVAPRIADQVRKVLDMPRIPNFKINDEDTQLVRTLWDHYTYSGFLSARILSYLTVSNSHIVDKDVIIELLDSLPKKPFEIMAVHDCFGVHPNYGNDVRAQYNLLLSKLADSNLLSYIVSQILGRYTPINKQDHTLGRMALEANYALS